MQCHFLGTNGWYDTPAGNTTCILLESDEGFFILDAGNGIQRMNQFDTGDLPVHLFLSHFHLDHIAGLHILNKFRFSGGLVIHGPPGVTKLMSFFLNPPFTISWRELPFPVTFHELQEKGYKIPVPFECRELLHSSPCFGYRFSLEGRTITYCPDTGYCSNAVRLAEEADLLITECAFLQGMENVKWPHLNPETAIRIAREAGARQLALVHFDAHLYRTLEDRYAIMDAFSDDFPGLHIATDGLCLSV